MKTDPLMRIGTRGSPLALAQAHEVRDRLIGAHPSLRDPEAVEIVVIKTTGDMILDRNLADIGGKGLFTKEIDEAQLDGRIDIAVHSMKDMPTILPEGLDLPCLLAREDVRDVFISPKAETLDDLPAGAVVGTASLRRQAQILHRRPDLNVISFRGNVQTRLRKLNEGEVDATLLAKAGLNRLGLPELATSVMETDEMLPAVGQGAVGVTCRAGDRRIRDLLSPLHDPPTADRVQAERAFLEVLDGSCRTPIAGLARLIDDETLVLQGLLARPDGSEVLTTERQGARAEARALGISAGKELKERAGPNFLAPSEGA